METDLISEKEAAKMFSRAEKLLSKPEFAKKFLENTIKLKYAMYGAVHETDTALMYKLPEQQKVKLELLLRAVCYLRFWLTKIYEEVEKIEGR